MSTLQITKQPKISNNATNSDLNSVRIFKSSIMPLCSAKNLLKFKNNTKSRFLLPMKKSINYSPPMQQKRDKITVVRIVDINRNIFRKLPTYRNPNKLPRPIFYNQKLKRNSMSHLSRAKMQMNPLKYYSNLLRMHMTKRKKKLARVLSFDFPKENCEIKCCSPLSIMGTCITPKSDDKPYSETTSRLGSP